MAIPDRLTTTVSTEGHVILPQAIRRALRWEAGMRLVVEPTRDGVELKPLPAFVETRPEDVFGSLAWKGEPKSLAAMEAGALEEAKRHDGGGRRQSDYCPRTAGSTSAANRSAAACASGFAAAKFGPMTANFSIPSSTRSPSPPI